MRCKSHDTFLKQLYALTIIFQCSAYADYRFPTTLHSLTLPQYVPDLGSIFLNGKVIICISIIYSPGRAFVGSPASPPRTLGLAGILN